MVMVNEGGVEMDVRSYFYIDEKEFYRICNQLIQNIDLISKKKSTNSNITYGINTGSFDLLKKLLPNISLDGSLNGQFEDSADIRITIEDKISSVLECFAEPEDISSIWLSNQLCDGEIFVGKGDFALTKIVTKEGDIEYFDEIENLDYTLSRLPYDAVLVFEANSLIRQEPDDNIPPIEMRMNIQKIEKGIHHYYKKIVEYVDFRFKILGEIDITSNYILVNPIVVWR